MVQIRREISITADHPDPILRVWRKTTTVQMEYLTPEGEWVEVEELGVIPEQAALSQWVVS